MLSDVREIRRTAIVTLICFTEQNIRSNLFIIQKNIKGGNTSNYMVLLFSDTISKRNNRQLHLLAWASAENFPGGAKSTFRLSFSAC